MNTIPTITRHDIRTFVGEQNFLKGQQHNRAGAIVNPVQLGMELKAYCYGSLPEPYRVQVTCNDTGIIAALCSCSAGTPIYGGRSCEHAAALLLAWTEQPEAFTPMDDIDTILERQSKTQLIALTKQLLLKQPENAMADRLKKEDFARLLAARMKTDEATATACSLSAQRPSVRPFLSSCSNS